MIEKVLKLTGTQRGIISDLSCPSHPKINSYLGVRQSVFGDPVLVCSSCRYALSALQYTRKYSCGLDWLAAARAIGLPRPEAEAEQERQREELLAAHHVGMSKFTDLVVDGKLPPMFGCWALMKHRTLAEIMPSVSLPGKERFKNALVRLDHDCLGRVVAITVAVVDHTWAARSITQHFFDPGKRELTFAFQEDPGFIDGAIIVGVDECSAGLAHFGVSHWPAEARLPVAQLASKPIGCVPELPYSSVIVATHKENIGGAICLSGCQSVKAVEAAFPEEWKSPDILNRARPLIEFAAHKVASAPASDVRNQIGETLHSFHWPAEQTTQLIQMVTELLALRGLTINLSDESSADAIPLCSPDGKFFCHNKAYFVRGSGHPQQITNFSVLLERDLLVNKSLTHEVTLRVGNSSCSASIPSAVFSNSKKLLDALRVAAAANDMELPTFYNARHGKDLPSIISTTQRRPPVIRRSPDVAGELDHLVEYARAPRVKGRKFVTQWRDGQSLVILEDVTQLVPIRSKRRLTAEIKRRFGAEYGWVRFGKSKQYRGWRIPKE